MSEASPAPARRLRWRPWMNLVLLLVALLVHSGVTGVWTVKQDEQGVVLRFGRVVRVVGPGIQFTLPYPVEELLRARTTEVRNMSLGFRMADAIRDIPPSAEQAQWLTGNTNIVELKAILQYVVKGSRDYLLNVANFSDGRPRDRVLRQVGESVLTALIARMQVDEVLSTGKTFLQEEGRRQMQAALDAIEIGIQVVSLNITEVLPPPNVIAAFNDVSSAKADRDRMVTEAEGYATNILPRARSRANRTIQEAEMYRSKVVNGAQGASSRFLQLAREVAAAPAVSRRRLWLETVQRCLAEVQVIQYAHTPGERFRLNLPD